MANVLYTVPLGLPIQPFIGGGAGLVHTSIKGQGEYGFCDLCLKAQDADLFRVRCRSSTWNTNGSSDRFGWQGIAGLSWPIAPRWTLDATYRYVRASERHGPCGPEALTLKASSLPTCSTVPIPTTRSHSASATISAAVDAIFMFSLMLPRVFLYEVSIIRVKLIERGRAKVKKRRGLPQPAGTCHGPCRGAGYPV